MSRQNKHGTEIN